ncbi:plasmid transfer protein TraA [Kitasatospora griseola]|uniref:plasmid transfer protein TraA n=1 Tax=Kitasatospora griseola TaxID=2064 RepID=UPI0036495EC5
MSTPYSSGNPFPPPRRTGAQQTSRTQGRPGTNTGDGGGKSYHFHYSPNTANGGSGRGNAGGSAQGGGIGQPSGGGQSAGGRANYSPLGDPEFFTNADVRAYCEKGRSLLMQLSFELSMAHEILRAVLREVPDPEGKPFGSQARARRVAKHLGKAADDAKDCAAELARTYAAFQREYDPEISRVAKPRQPRRKFDFGG